MIKKLTSPKALMALLATLLMGISPALASEADLVVPSIKAVNSDFFMLLVAGILISVAGLIFGFIEFFRIKKLRDNISCSLYTSLKIISFRTLKPISVARKLSPTI